MDYVLQNVKSNFVAPIYINMCSMKESKHYEEDYDTKTNTHISGNVIYQIIICTEEVSSGQFKLLDTKMLSRVGLNVGDKFSLNNKIEIINDKYINEDESITYIISDKAYEPDNEEHKKLVIDQANILRDKYKSEGKIVRLYNGIENTVTL